jgi:hypothetical protein
VEPGLVRTEIGCKNTGGLVGFIWERRKRHGVDPETPAAIYERIIMADVAPGCLCHAIGGPAAVSREVNRKNADRLFSLSEKLCNIRFGVYDECLS